MSDKPYGLEVKFSTKTKTFWYDTPEKRRKAELKFFGNKKVQVVSTIGKPD